MNKQKKILKRITKILIIISIFVILCAAILANEVRNAFLSMPDNPNEFAGF